MDQIRARNILTQMWTLLFAAREGKLTENEIAWLREFCDEIKDGIPGFDTFNSHAESVCRSIASLTELEEPDDDYVIELLLKLSQLRELLDRPS